MSQRKNKNQNIDLKSEALTLYVAGLSTREIARRLGTSKSTISRILSTAKHSAQSTPAYSSSASRSEDREGGRRPEGLNGDGIGEANPPSAYSSSASRSEDGRRPEGLNGDGIGEVSRSDVGVNNQGADNIINKAHTAVIDLIRQIQKVTDGETDVAKLATAADKLSAIAERIANVQRIATIANDNNGMFTADFASRHKRKNN